MPTNITPPGVYVEEMPNNNHSVIPAPTAITAFLGRAKKGDANTPTSVSNFGEFERMFGGLGKDYPLSYAIQDFFLNGGEQAIIVRLIPSKEDSDETSEQNDDTPKNDKAHKNGRRLCASDYLGSQEEQTGLYALEKVEIFNILCIPPDSTTPEWVDIDELVWQTASIYCQQRNAFLLVDPPSRWSEKYKVGKSSDIDSISLGIVGEPARYAATYFPRIEKEDPLRDMNVRQFPICGVIAALYARTDRESGVWKAPAGISSSILGIKQLQFNLTDMESGTLNEQAINALRNMRDVGPVAWGVRTLRGQTNLDDDYKYIQVRRLVNYIKLSIQQSISWAAFQPNDEQLWSTLRQSIGGFMKELQNQGAFYSYQVACDATTTTATDIEQGIVNISIQIAPVTPAEFIIIQISQHGLLDSG